VAESGWFVLPSEMLLKALQRVSEGEAPQLVYAEVYANTAFDAEGAQMRAWKHMNEVLDEHGESPEYRTAWAAWTALAFARESDGLGSSS